MSLRTGHGKGRGAPRIEVRPLDEISAPNADATATNLATRRARGRPFEPGNAAARGRKPALALLVPCDSSDPEYCRLMRQASRYRRRRAGEGGERGGREGGSELAAAYGYLSSGASSLLSVRGARHGCESLLLRQGGRDRRRRVAQAREHAQQSCPTRSAVRSTSHAREARAVPKCWRSSRTYPPTQLAPWRSSSHSRPKPQL